MQILLMGAPGAGKGTLAGKLTAKLDLPHISTGDMLRQATKAGSDLGRKVEAVMNAGELVSDELMIEVVKDALGKSPSFILDGFPRTKPQAEALGGITKVSHVLYLDVPDDSVIKRISGRRTCPTCGEIYNIYFDPADAACRKCNHDFSKKELVQRKDDNEDTVKNRLQVFHKSSSPLLDFYDHKDLLIKIKATHSPEEVLSEALKALK